MTRPASARVSRRDKDGRKVTVSMRGAVMSPSQYNTFNRRRLFTAVPSEVTVSQDIWSFDEDTDMMTESTVSAGQNLDSLPVEVVQIYNEDGSLATFPLEFVNVDGTYFTQNVTAITNNSPVTVVIHEAIFPSLRGKYLTHNHPNGVPFSFDDFVLSRDARLAGIEAVPNKRKFWGNVQEINQNQRQLMRALESIRNEQQRAGLQENLSVVDRMMMFALQMTPNSAQPKVSFQARPAVNKGWSTKIPKDEWFNSAYMHLSVKLFSKIPSMSKDARDLLLGHALSEVFAERMGFSYSITGLE
ncbi:MAG: hypothetical protein ACK5XN_13415 [Bacteroidota bacterium]|jgi:hypothetical protein